jgi:thiol-disulfide isomerase/thioredoxin
MKKLIFILSIAVFITSCQKKDYAEFKVKFDGLEEADSVMTVRGMGINKKVMIDENGYFHDTIKLEKSNFVNFLLGRKANVQSFLGNDFNLDIYADVTKIDSTLKFKGKGSQNSIYLAERVKQVKAFSENLNSMYEKDSVEFHQEIDAFKARMTDLLNQGKKIDTALIRLENQGLDGYVKQLTSSYKIRHEAAVKFKKGNPSPTFENYENYKGGKSSLKDFKGKFVYIDVWATWCKPCIGQIPALKELEEEYKGKNIEFVSISTDKKEAYSKWKDMIKEKEMGGVQLWAGDDQQFSIDYNIRSIPRFIFIDPDGNIVNANAPRPSMKEQVKKMFDEAGV